MKHVSFIARTALVRNGDVDQALRLVNSLMAKEGLFQQYRRTRFYEKPYEMRRRVNFEKCKAIYNEEMARKLEFIVRSDRTDPFPGCS